MSMMLRGCLRSLASSGLQRLFGALALSTLLALSVSSAGRAAAQSEPPGLRTVRTHTGVSFPLPERFAAIPGVQTHAPSGNAGPVTEHAFADRTDLSVRVVVTRAALATDPVLRTLPMRSGALPDAFAQGYVAGMERAVPGTAVEAGEYDAARHAFSARIEQRRQPASAYADHAAAKDRPDLTSLAVNFLTPGAMTVVTVSGPPARNADLELLLSSIWQSAQVASSHEHEPSRLTRLLAFSDLQLARSLGVALGALLGGAVIFALLVWGRRALRAPTVLDTIPAALLLGSVLFEMTTSALPSAYLPLKLIGYAVGIAWARHILVSRRRQLASSSPSPSQAGR